MPNEFNYTYHAIQDRQRRGLTGRRNPMFRTNHIEVEATALQTAHPVLLRERRSEAIALELQPWPTESPGPLPLNGSGRMLACARSRARMSPCFSGVMRSNENTFGARARNRRDSRCARCG